MWTTPPGWREALSGDIGMGASAAVWLGGAVTVDELEILAGSVTSELSGDQVQTSVSLTAGDPEGDLFTGWSGDRLGTLGHRIRLASIVSAGDWLVTVPVGTLRVNTVDIASSSPWRLYMPDHPEATPETHGRWVRGAQVLSVSCGDLLDQVADEDFLAPTSPPSGSTIGSEIQRLAAGIVSVGDSVLALDGSVPSSITYDDQDRLGSLVALFRAAGQVLALDRDAVLQAIPSTGSGSVWDVPMDALIRALPSADRSELRNGWVVASESEEREPLRGQALEEEGPLIWGGPFGRVPAFAHSPILTSNSQCNSAARTNRDAAQASRRMVLDIECGTDPAVDVLDTARIALPLGAVDGLILRINRPLFGRTMTVSVSVDWEAFRV